MIKNLRAYQFKINLFVALVLILNAFAPLSVVAKEFSSAKEVGIEALYGDNILICTPTGFKYISIDELNDMEKNGQSSDQSHCPLCQISAFSTILALIEFNAFNVPSNYGSVQTIYVEDDLLLSPSRTRNIKARAPPVSL